MVRLDVQLPCPVRRSSKRLPDQTAIGSSTVASIRQTKCSFVRINHKNQLDISLLLNHIILVILMDHMVILITNQVTLMKILTANLDHTPQTDVTSAGDKYWISSNV